MTTLKERLQEVMSEHGLTTQQHLADFAKVSKGLVNQWFKGYTGLGRKPLLEFDKKTNFSSQWLAEGSGSKYKNNRGNENSTTLSNTIASSEVNRTALKLHNIRISCGFGSSNSDIHELLRTIEIPNHILVELLGTQNLNNVELMPPDGDSMEPTIPRRSIILIKTDIDRFQDSGIYLITFDGYTYIKRLARGKSGVIKVISDNKKYTDSDFEIEPNEVDLLTIHGKFWKALPIDFIEI